MTKRKRDKAKSPRRYCFLRRDPSAADAGAGAAEGAAVAAAVATSSPFQRKISDAKTG
jgi:hypothetical protein